MIVLKGSNIGGLAPVGAQRLCLLRFRLVVSLDRASIDIDRGLFGVGIVISREMNPFIFRDSLKSCSSIHCLVLVSLEKAHSALVHDFKVVLSLFSGVRYSRGLCHEYLVYIRACDVLDLDPSCYSNTQSWLTLIRNSNCLSKKLSVTSQEMSLSVAENRAFSHRGSSPKKNVISDFKLRDIRENTGVSQIMFSI